MAYGLGLMILGLWFRVQVQGLGFRVQGLGFRLRTVRVHDPRRHRLRARLVTVGPGFTVEGSLRPEV